MKRFCFLLCFLSSLSLYSQTVTHGPIIGGVTDNSARAVIFTDAPTSFEFQIDTVSSFSNAKTFTGITDTARGNSIIITIDSLNAYAQYYYRVLIGGNVSSYVGEFKTHPCTGETGDYVFHFGSCQNQDRINDAVYAEMQNHPADIFLQIGDWTYEDETDNLPNNNDVYSADYNRVITAYKHKYDYNNMKAYLEKVHVAYVWDDHDFVNNNSSRNHSSYTDFDILNPQVLEIPYPPGARRNIIKGYYELFPGYPPVDSSEGVFHKFRYGNMEFFMLDNRAARTPGSESLKKVNGQWTFDPPPGHTILGQIQRDWLLNNLKKSTATWKFVITGTAFNQSYKNTLNSLINLPQLAGLPIAAALVDSWTGYPLDSDSLINVVNNNNIDGVILLSGDTHTTGIDDGSNGGLPEVMAGCLSQTNSALFLTVPLMGFGLNWSEGGQGIGNANTKDSFGKIACTGDNSLAMEIIDEDGGLIADYTIYSCSFKTGLTLTADTIKPVNCFGNNSGVVNLTSTGGTPPYSYTFNGENFNSTGIFDTLSAGKYTFAVKDNAGCTKELCIHITQPKLFETSVTKLVVSCFGLSDGEVDVSSTGGVLPYQYYWSTGDSGLTQITNLAAGQYTVSAVDDNNCFEEKIITIDQPDSLMANASITGIKCNGDNNGLISLNISGGTPSYNVVWENGSTNLNRTNLSTGQYSFQLTDGNGCNFSDTIILSNPDSVLVTVGVTHDYTGNNSGSIKIKIIGGTLPYTYQWLSDGSNDSQLDNLGPGTYSVIVTDANGCQKLVVTTITLGTYIEDLSVIELSVFPNPASNNININLNLPFVIEGKIVVFNYLGKEIYSENRRLEKTNRLKINLSDFAEGVYFLEIESKLFKKLMPFSVVH